MWTWSNAGYTAATLNPLLTATGATGLQSGTYWSSTEYSTTRAWSVYFYYGHVNNSNKTNERFVRAAFAF